MGAEPETGQLERGDRSIYECGNCGALEVFFELVIDTEYGGRLEYTCRACGKRWEEACEV
jgi:DNA-directed RNA polymerase subunit M/transcription elongation factor TFIIS